mgnify:CR=1 FL=1
MSGAGLAHGREIAAQMRLENVAAGRCINTKKNGEPHGPVEVGYKACSACSAAHSGPRKAATATTLEQVAIAHTTIPPVARHGALTFSLHEQRKGSSLMRGRSESLCS